MGSSRYPSSAWNAMRSPDLDAIESLARAAWENMPEEFRALCDDLVIRVAEFPEDDVVEQMNLESPFDILGLFTGVGMAHAPALPETGGEPNVIHLYRRPILDYWAENDETLGDIVAHVLVHEIGHHFGLSDDDMDEIEARA
jgi:predicted Zn-dependent protease with MMP-like domain